ncbi:MAG TPA: DUF5615 family PIN-like protein [Planctomycetota bacterium]|nr:DUF5615 family PIN-like protein [Planctomycetota bacterium]
MPVSERETLRLLLDAHIHVRAAKILRLRGFDVISVWEIGRQALPDEAHVAWAAENGRCIITYNVAHFSRAHYRWLAEGGHHSGIAVCKQIGLREFLRRCHALLRTHTPAMVRDQFLWLPSA